MDSVAVNLTFLTLVLALADQHNIVGIVYLMRNKINGKKYVGQTLSHRKNHEKFRPFGEVGRFKDHVSEAMCNTKTKQCRYLNAAIRKHGADAFEVSVLAYCEVKDLDALEIQFIKEQNCLAPHGYNLTSGGREWTERGAFGDDSEVHEENKVDYQKQARTSKRSETTKELISTQLQAYFETSAGQTAKTERSARVQEQHAAKKFERFKGVKIDKENLEQYVNPGFKDGVFSHYNVRINGVRTAIRGKYNTQEELKSTALQFVKEVAAQN